MTAARTAWLGSVAALLFAACALAFAAQTLRATPDRLQQLERRRSDWANLEALAADRRADAARLAELTRAGAARPLGDWLRELKPDWNAEVREKERRPITADWSLQQAQVTMADVNLAELDEVLRQLAAATPPWRTVELTLTAVDSGAGRARVSLLMEGLAHAPAASP